MIFLGGTIAALAVVCWLAFRLSPWPMVLLIRRAPGMSGHAIEALLQPLVPQGVREFLDERYDPSDRDGYLDVFVPEHATAGLPTIVWVHGGAFIAGSRIGVRNYLRIMAARGYTTVAVEYSHAPERRYPTPVAQLDAALAFLRRNAQRLRVDPGRAAGRPVRDGGRGAGARHDFGLRPIRFGPAGLCRAPCALSPDGVVGLHRYQKIS